MPEGYDFVPEGGFTGAQRDIYRQPKDQPYIYKFPETPGTRDPIPDPGWEPPEMREAHPGVIDPKSLRAVPRQSAPPIGLDYTQTNLNWDHFPTAALGVVPGTYS